MHLSKKFTFERKNCSKLHSLPKRKDTKILRSSKRLLATKINIERSYSNKTSQLQTSLARVRQAVAFSDLFWLNLLITTFFIVLMYTYFKLIYETQTVTAAIQTHELVLHDLNDKLSRTNAFTAIMNRDYSNLKPQIADMMQYMDTDKGFILTSIIVVVVPLVISLFYG